MSLVKVSVIIAARDAQDTIRSCLDSLLRLEYPRDRRELIVVDNGSRDATSEILAGYTSEFTVLSEAQPGPAAARNTGLRHASADVVAFTDADCVVDPHWLSHIIPPLSDPTVGVVGGRNLAYRPRNSIARFGERIHDHRKAIEDCVPPYAITMDWASRRGVLEDAGLFDPRLLRCSDVDMAFRLVQAGYRLVYESDAVVYHWNRSTVWSLMRQGYAHGYHGAVIRRHHAAFLRRAHEKQIAPGPGRADRRPLVREVISDGYAFVVWALFFEAAKRIGRLHAAVADAGVGITSEKRIAP